MMKFVDEPLTKCPVCNDMLYKQKKVYICSKNHSFDIAKEGYVNLLNNNRARSSGDNKMMLNSRRDFLNNNYYRVISDWLVNYMIGNVLETRNDSTFKILDVGCGEGYYLNQLRRKLSSLPNRLDYYGIDISKEAISMAAKWDCEINWIVANANNLPFRNKSMDYIISMFPSFVNFKEMERLIKKGGLIILIQAGENHLKELKEIIYPEIISKDVPSFSNTLPTETHELSYNINIDSTKDILNLLTMTPHYWKIKNDRLEMVKKLGMLDTTVDVKIQVWICS